MGAIEVSLAALKEATALTAKIPFIAPVAGLLLQALTMRDASILLTPHNRLYLTNALTGTEAQQGRMGRCHGQARENCRLSRSIWHAV